MDLINTRRKIKRKLIRNDYNDKEMLGQFYLVNKTIREEIKAIKNNKWATFIEKIGKNPLSSKVVWNRIQVIKNNGKKSNEKYPTLINENIKYETDDKKANLFAELLSATFKDDEKEKYEEIECFNKNLNNILKNLKSKLSSGQDKISNIMLKNINEKFKIVLLHLCKTTVKTMNIPKLWKQVIVRMIPKKMMAKRIQKTIGQYQLPAVLLDYVKDLF